MNEIDKAELKAWVKEAVVEWLEGIAADFGKMSLKWIVGAATTLIALAMVKSHL